MILIVFLLAPLVGVALIGVALTMTFQRSPFDFAGAASDLMIKLAIVVIGISFGLLAFFGQRWIEDANEQIQQANDAFGNVDLIQAEYMSDVEKAYFDNENDFVDLYRACSHEFAHLKDVVAFCEQDEPAGEPLSYQVVLDARAYLSTPMASSILDNFPNRLYEQTYIKRHADPALMHNLFFEYSMFQSWFSIMKQDYDKARKDADDFEATGIEEDDLKQPDKNDKFLRYQHQMCCSMLSIHQDSKLTADHGDRQAANFCALRRDLYGKLSKTTEPLIRHLAQSRFDEITARLAYYDDPKACRYQPEPPDPVVDPSQVDDPDTLGHRGAEAAPASGG